MSLSHQNHTPIFHSWMDAVQKTCQSNDAVLVSVLGVKGSAPAVVGEKMVVAKNCILFGSIGGGHLEFDALNFAYKMLKSSISQPNKFFFTKTYALGANLGQCCGGQVRLTFEYLSQQRSVWWRTLGQFLSKQKTVVMATLINNSDGDNHCNYSGQKCLFSTDKNKSTKIFNNHLSFTTNQRIQSIADEFLTEDSVHKTSYRQVQIDGEIRHVFFEKVCPEHSHKIALFGAGHIGRALISILNTLPVEIFWLDDRSDELAKFTGDLSQVRVICEPFLDGIDRLPVDFFALVLTYSHQHDFDICEALLQKNKANKIGLIGSKTKGAHFKQRLKRKNISNQHITKLVCPIGKKRVNIQSPAAIAIALANEVLDFLERTPQKMSI